MVASPRQPKTNKSTISVFVRRSHCCSDGEGDCVLSDRSMDGGRKKKKKPTDQDAEKGLSTIILSIAVSLAIFLNL